MQVVLGSIATPTKYTLTTIFESATLKKRSFLCFFSGLSSISWKSVSHRPGFWRSPSSGSPALVRSVVSNQSDRYSVCFPSRNQAYG